MSDKPHILVVDDEPVIRHSLTDWFAEDGYPIDAAADAPEALKLLEEAVYDIVLLDIKMPGMDGLALQTRIVKTQPDAVIIIMTAYASVDSAVQALKAGAYDYVQKPFDPENLQRLIEKASEHHRLVRENRQLKHNLRVLTEETDISEIVGETPGILRVRELIRTVAQNDVPVLITGERGTGKDWVASAIHQRSARKHMPLVMAYCAGLPAALIETELFGHGTGPGASGKGKFERAGGGSIFIDEIADIDPKTQIELLRILREKTFTRPGDAHPIRADFRIMAATSRDLSEAVRKGRFRQDLFYRLNVFTIDIPSLRDHPDDIRLLAGYFLEKYARQMGRPAPRFAPGALSYIESHTWPGNVRELENAIERALVVQQGEEIQLADLPGHHMPLSPDADLSLARCEKRHIQAVLNTMQGNITRSARALGIDRVTLYNKIRKYDLIRPI